MKKKTFLEIVILMSVILALYVVNDKLVFYNFNESTADKSIVLNSDSVNKFETQLLWFDYNDNEISINKNILLSSENLNLYTLNNKEEQESIKISENSQKLSEDFTGSFLATLPVKQIDIDSDGRNENVLLTAKTDTLLTQGFNMVRTNFSNENIPIEVVLSNKKDISIYLNGVLLANQNVRIKSARGLDEVYKTDANGTISSLKIKDIRSGITVSYEDDNGKYYICSYIVESNKLFTPLYFEAMKPFLYCCLLSAVGIIAICIIRKYTYKYA
ncbi:MAG: hypothetical protein ACI4PU_00975 [Intestinibacter sp.]